MTIYRVESTVGGAKHDARHFKSLANATNEAEHLARIFAAMYESGFEREDVNRYGIVAVWGTNDTGIKIERCDVED